MDPPRTKKRSKRRGKSADDLGTFVATSYGPPWGGIQGTGVTAGGTDLSNAPHTYIVAVDPTVIPLGTHLAIWPNPFGYKGSFLADDTGGAIKGKRIDFYDWRGRSKQLGWGTRRVRVARGSAQQLTTILDDIEGTLGIKPGEDDNSVLPPGISGDIPGSSLLGGLVDPLNAISDALRAISSFFVGMGELLLTREGQLRLGKIIVGAVLLYLGISRLLRAASGTPARGAVGGAIRIGKRGWVGAAIGAAKGAVGRE